MATEALQDAAPVAASRAPQWVGIVLAPVVLGGFFWLAGRVDWVGGWLWLGAMVLGQGASTLLVRAKDPELIRRRGEIGEGTKPWDKTLLGLFALTYVGLLVVAALELRLSWADSLPLWSAGLGLVLYIVGTVLLTRSMQANTHFEKSVRIQVDRDHHVVDSGPYRVVRHPGYVATILAFAMAGPLLLGSRFAFIPAALVVIVLLVRTALEDRMLHAELEGYAEYATRTRYRLVPGLW